MELEFKCGSIDCNFSGNIDWPEEKLGGTHAVLEVEIWGNNPMSEHHDSTKIGLANTPEYRGHIYGHGTFFASMGNIDLKFLAKTNRVLIDNYPDYIDSVNFNEENK